MFKSSSSNKLGTPGLSASMLSLQDIRRRAATEGVGEDETEGAHNFEYEETLMYGKYAANLAEYARQEAKVIREEPKDDFSKELQPYRGKMARTVISVVRPVWEATFAKLGEDWVFLFVLGILMATISYLMDVVTSTCFSVRMSLDNYLQEVHWVPQLLSWIIIPTVLIVFSAAFCQWLSPSAAGSGIPEMKTILRGVVLKEYLAWKTLVAKLVGLAAVLGSGLPLGKEGPVMHMASIVATMLSKTLIFIKGSLENEARTTDLLAAASTMGVAVCYAAPIGGVLFSIEVTTVHFAVRNYFRGFFAAIVGAMFYRLMPVWIQGTDTIRALYEVELNFEYPYDVIELLPFLCIGIFCGFAGSLFVYVHRRYVIFMRQNKLLKAFLKKHRLLYPMIVALGISVTTFPMFLGQFMASTLSTKQQISDLFSNVTWSVTDPLGKMTLEQEQILRNWSYGGTGDAGFYLNLFIFAAISVIQIAVASTLPVPNGVLIPLFKVGAAFGRIIGEVMASLYPFGIFPGFPVIPGAYAMVGAASFCAAITHTISVSVITFELTGQITYVIPIMIGVLIASCISSLLQPSIYDSVIKIKKLPYLPDIITTTSHVYSIHVEDIMVREVKFIWYGMSYTELKRSLLENRKLKYLPLVDKPDSMILLGSVQRTELVRILIVQISPEKRRKEATRRHLESLRRKWEEEDALGLGTRGGARIRYEDELDAVNHTLKDTTNFLQRFSKSLTRSLSRSISLSRSPSRSEVHTPESSSDEEDNSSDNDAVFETDLPESAASTSDSPESLKKEKTSAVDEAEERGDKTASDEKKASKSAKARMAIELFKDRSNRFLTSSMGRKSSSEQKLPTLQRSSSLDSLHSSTKKKAVGDMTDGPADDSVTSPLSPSKGILKRRNSLSLGSLNVPTVPQQETNYVTVTAGDTKLRTALEKMRKMGLDTAYSMEFKLSQISLFKSKKKETPKKPVLDLTDEEKEMWEKEEMAKPVEFSLAQIDPSPFQLVERTSLLRVHSMFSMLGINHAFVTAIGRLIGVVALKEVRSAIEGQYLGQRSSSRMSNRFMSANELAKQSALKLTQTPIKSDPETGTVRSRSQSSMTDQIR